MVCKSCGFEFKDENNFCPGCGAKVEKEDTAIIEAMPKIDIFGEAMVQSDNSSLAEEKVILTENEKEDVDNKVDIEDKKNE